jgi:hypothetical protein
VAFELAPADPGQVLAFHAKRLSRDAWSSRLRNRVNPAGAALLVLSREAQVAGAGCQLFRMAHSAWHLDDDPSQRPC